MDPATQASFRLSLYNQTQAMPGSFEWSADREREFASTIPYYVYRLQLIARKDNSSINTWKDLRSATNDSKKRIGVLRGTKAEAYLHEMYGDDIEVVALSEEGSTGVMELVKNGQLDATVPLQELSQHLSPIPLQLLPPVVDVRELLCPAGLLGIVSQQS